MRDCPTKDRSSRHNFRALKARIRKIIMHNYSAHITGRKVRFALVGCGRIAKSHFAAIQQHHERCELVAVCDDDPAALAQASGSTGAEPYSSLADLLANSNADAVILTTPSGLHPEQAIQCAAAR